MKSRVFFLLALLALPMAASADSSTPLLYTRAAIMIERKAPPQKAVPPLPWQKGLISTMPDAPGIGFDVEVRDGMTLYNQKGWFNLSSQSEKNGVLMMFSAPGLPAIIHSTQYAPLDILMIDREGTITQIVPNIKLSELDRDITPASAIVAFLFLQGGLCQKLSINPGDVVEYKLFKKPPVVLTAPTDPTPTEPAPQPTPAAQ